MMGYVESIEARLMEDVYLQKGEVISPYRPVIYLPARHSQSLVTFPSSASEPPAARSSS